MTDEVKNFIDDNFGYHISGNAIDAYKLHQELLKKFPDAGVELFTVVFYLSSYYPGYFISATA